MMLCYTNLPYLNILSKWLGLESSGNVTLEDPYQEFFICKAPEPCEPFEEYQVWIHFMPYILLTQTLDQARYHLSLLY